MNNGNTKKRVPKNKGPKPKLELFKRETETAGLIEKCEKHLRVC